MQPVPTDLILHALAENLTGMEGDDESLRSLGHTILRTCIDLRALPAQWCNGAGVGQQMSWLTRRLEGGDCAPNAIFVTTGPNGTLIPTGPHVAAETRAMEVAISRRLADTAFSLLITQDDGDKTAALTLLEAAHRVVGLPSAEARPAEDRPSWTSWGDQVLGTTGASNAWIQHEVSRRLAKASTLVAQHEEMYAALRREVNAARADAAAHFEDVKTARDEADALRQKVAMFERDHAALGFTDQWKTWARNLLDVDDGTAQELQALIGKVVKRAEVSSRQNLAHLDAHKAILAALKLDPGASQSDIIETIKSLQADRAKLCALVCGDNDKTVDAPVDAPRFKIGDCVLASPSSKYAKIIDEHRGLFLVDSDGSATWLHPDNMRHVPKVDP